MSLAKSNKSVSKRQTEMPLSEHNIGVRSNAETSEFIQPASEREILMIGDDDHSAEDVVQFYENKPGESVTLNPHGVSREEMDLDVEISIAEDAANFGTRDVDQNVVIEEDSAMENSMMQNEKLFKKTPTPVDQKSETQNTDKERATALECTNELESLDAEQDARD